MPRRISTSQLRNKLRQAQSKRRQAIQKYNNAVRQHNSKVKRQFDEYNRGVRAHNARVRQNRARLTNAIRRLETEAKKPTRVKYTVQSRTVYQSYERLNERYDTGAYGENFNETLDLAEKEASNSAELESLLGEEPSDTEAEVIHEANPELLNTLSQIQSDLADRWKGALFSLSPKNPDAARHFCTSAREIFVRIFEVKASDSDVRTAIVDCELTPNGSPTRRSKIAYLLSKRGLGDQTLEEFVDNDIDNILSLFRVFNDGTHGSAGAYGTKQLAGIKTRVEDGMNFLLTIAS